MVQERLPARPALLEKEWTQDKENKLVTAYGVSLFCNKTYISIQRTVSMFHDIFFNNTCNPLLVF